MTHSPTVFLSYSHNDLGPLESLVQILEGVSINGRALRLWYDKEHITTGDRWYPALIDAIEQAQVAVLILTDSYLNSDFCIEEELPLILQREQAGHLTVLPLYLSECDWEGHPWLTQYQIYPPGTPVSDLGDLNEALAMFAGRVKSAALDEQLPVIERSRRFFDLSRLPSTGSLLFDRVAELKILDEAWRDPGSGVLSIVADGGQGKSTLVRVWAESIYHRGWLAADRAFAWSFQSGDSQHIAESDEFFSAILEWLGEDSNLDSHWHRAETLASLVASERFLLILDGLERLQERAGTVQGQIRDAAIRTLVEELTTNNRGLCIITSREPLTDVTLHQNNQLKHYSLQAASPKAGKMLLRAAGVRGSDEELREAVDRLQRRVLAVRLAATYAGSTRARHVVAVHDALDREADGAVECLASAWIDKLGAPSRDLVMMASISEEPISLQWVEVLLAPPALPGLSGHLTMANLREALDEAVSAGLLATSSVSKNLAIDMHPAVRDYVKDIVRADWLASWRHAHDRLYAHYSSTAVDLPRSISEMRPLYRAVSHGCEAGRTDATLTDVFWRRINREEEFYNTRQLGSWSSDLACLERFFDTPWISVDSEIPVKRHGWILGQAGFALKALGRLDDSAEVMRRSCSVSKDFDLEELPVRLRNLAEVELARCQIEAAVAASQESLEHAESMRESRPEQVLFSLSRLGESLHHLGELDQANEMFQHAQELNEVVRVRYGIVVDSIMSLQGFQLCDFLLDYSSEHYWYVLAAALDAKILSTSPLEQALADLTTARARLAMGDITEASVALRESETFFHRAGQIDYLVRALILKAELCLAEASTMQDRDMVGAARRLWEEGEAALASALLRCSRAGLVLREVDAKVVLCRILLAQGSDESMLRCQSISGEVFDAVTTTRYRRRLAEAIDLEEELARRL